MLSLKRAVIFLMLIFSLSNFAFSDTVLNIYRQFTEANAALQAQTGVADGASDTSDSSVATESSGNSALQEFHAAVSAFMQSQEFQVLAVQQGQMAGLVSKMQTASSPAEIDSLMISYLEQSRAVLLKNQRYILFVTLLLSALVIIVSAAVFYVILVSEKNRVAKEIFFELERERTRISFELHDTVAQEITSASLILKSGGKLQDAQELLETSQKEIRSILSALNPPALKESSIENLMGELCSSFQKSSGVECSLNITGDFSILTFSAEEKLNIFRIVQESLSNIQKHAAASSVQVIFRRNGAGKKGYVFFVCDDGRGFDALKREAQNHFGLKSIEQRVSILGGSLKITSGAQMGTTIRVEVAK